MLTTHSGLRAILLAAVFLAAGSGLVGQSLERLTAPQVVGSSSFITEMVLLNLSSTTCNVSLSFHEGGGNPPSVPLLIDGAPSQASTIPVAVPGLGTSRITLGSNSDFVGAATLDIVQGFCTGNIQMQAQYFIRNDQNQLSELFSYPTPDSISRGGCVRAPVKLDLNPIDGQTTRPGIAFVSPQALTGVTIGIDVWDSNNNPLGHASIENYDGRRTSMFLNQFQGLQGLNDFVGSVDVCVQTEDSDPQNIVSVTPLFIDVVQEPGGFQFDSNQAEPRNPGCQPNETTFCLNEGRFQVNVNLGDNPSAPGDPVPVGKLGQDDSGFFFFTDPGNFELLVKIIDGGCGLNNHFWVFYGSTTNVEFTLRVEDHEGEIVKQYFNPLGSPADAVTDTQAFATCP